MTGTTTPVPDRLDLVDAIAALEPWERRLAHAYLWGTMTVRDPEACMDALRFARGESTVSMVAEG